MSHEAKHTPGPWHLRSTRRGSWVVEGARHRSSSHTSRPIKICAITDEVPEHERRSTAALIHAAPEMVKALEEIASGHTAAASQEIARRALRLAWGEP